MTGGPRHFLDLGEVDPAELRRMAEEARRRKADRMGMPALAVDEDAPLAGHALAMLFERPSTRTRVSFELAIRQLGGGAILLSAAETHLGRGSHGESIADTARVLSRYADAAMIRATSHGSLLAFAEHAAVPVINGLTYRSHPCQVLGDVMTFEERLGPIRGRTIAWCGDGNNVAHSFIQAAGRFGFRLRLACPEGHGPDPGILGTARGEGAEIDCLEDPDEAVRGADCVVTDAWASMGDEEDATARQERFSPYRIDSARMARAAPHAIFLHCLPAHRGEEVVDEVMDGPQSAVFDEAENRLHIQKAILLHCFDQLP